MSHSEGTLPLTNSPSALCYFHQVSLVLWKTSACQTVSCCQMEKTKHWSPGIEPGSLAQSTSLETVMPPDSGKKARRQDVAVPTSSPGSQPSDSVLWTQKHSPNTRAHAQTRTHTRLRCVQKVWEAS